MSWKRIDGPRLVAAVALLSTFAGPARADDSPTPGFPEKIVQWGVQKGETCEDIATAMYGSARHRALLLRYNRITCTPGAPLEEGLTLVLPAKVTTVPTARITSVNPETQARPPGGGWGPAYSGQGLERNSNVNTRDEGRAAIQFVDRSRIYLAEHTLVVIFGTASQTAVSKTVPPVAEVKSGELQAGLTALRGGRSAEVAVAGGGRVSATSRDTVIRKKQERATVSVFDGTAKVSSAGAAVDVPTNFGTAVVEQKAPEPPRPLPPAPVWDAGGSPLVTLADGDEGVLRARWNAVPKAARYRLEVATVADFSTVVLREEVPADVLAFRAEKIPPGDYWLRVRAIDTEDFLGLAATSRAVSVLRASFSRGSGGLDGAGFEVSPYGVLDLAPSKGLEMALDDEAFGPVPAQLDFAQRRPKQLRFKRRGASEPMTVPIRYVPPSVAIEAARRDGELTVTVTFSELRGVDAAEVIGPRARLRSPDGSARGLTLEPIGPDRFRGVAPVTDGGVAVDVIDRGGTVMGTEIVGRRTELTPPPAPEPDPIFIGPTNPMRPFSPRVDVIAWAPTTRSTAALGTSVDSGAGDGLGMSGDVYVAGGLGAVGLDLALRHRRRLDGSTSDTAGWLGARYRFLDLDALQLGTGLRFGFPLDDVGAPMRLEPSLAAGAAHDDWSWLANVGGRIRLHDPEGRVFVDDGHVFAIAGGAYDVLPWMRLFSSLDGHVLFDQDVRFRGGLSLGLEVGTVVYGSLAGRASPWKDAGGHVGGQVAIGIRSF